MTATATKRVYLFAEGDKSMRDLLKSERVRIAGHVCITS